MRILYTATSRARLLAVLVTCLLMGQVIAVAHTHDIHEAVSVVDCDACHSADRVDLGPTSVVAESQHLDQSGELRGILLCDADHSLRVTTCEARAPPRRAQA